MVYFNEVQHLCKRNLCVYFENLGLFRFIFGRPVWFIQRGKMLRHDFGCVFRASILIHLKA